MKNVPYPVLGVSDNGDTKLMQPEQDYKFQGNTVTEYPMTRQDKGQLKKLDQLTKFKKGGKLKKAQMDQTAYMKANNISMDEVMGTAQQVKPLEGAVGKLGGVGGILNTGTELLEGFQNLKQEKEQRGQAEQFAALSGIVNQASSIRPEGPKRKYVRPEDQIVDPNQLSQSYGTGTNFLQAQFGAQTTPGYNPSDSSYTAIVKTPQGKRAYQGKSLDQATAMKKALSKSRMMPSDSLSIKKYQKGGTQPIQSETKEELYNYYNSAVGHHPISPIYAEDDGRLSRNTLVSRFNTFNELNNKGPKTNVAPPGIDPKVFDAMNAVRDKKRDFNSFTPYRTKYAKGGEIQNTYAPKTLYNGLEEAQFGLGNIGAKQIGNAGNANY